LSPADAVALPPSAVFAPAAVPASEPTDDAAPEAEMGIVPGAPLPALDTVDEAGKVTADIGDEVDASPLKPYMPPIGEP
jgi:hypothetical protein